MTFKSTLHRAAVLIKSLNENQAEILLSRLEPNELKQLSEAIQALDEFDIGQQQLARRKFIAFAESFKSGRIRQANVNELEMPFAFLINTDKALRHALLVEEHPKFIAMILSLLPIQTAAETLIGFENVQRVGILRRLCRPEKIDSQELERCSITMKKRLKKILVQACCESDRINAASRLLSCTDAATRESVFDSLASNDQDLATDLKSRLIGFDILLHLCDADIKTILARTDTSLWAPALVHSPSEIRRRIFDNLAEQPASILRNEIGETVNADFLIGSSAQASIVCSLLELADAGLVQLDSNQKQAA